MSTKKKPSPKILTTPRMERCIGCHSCSLACARLVNRRLSWDTAGIRIVSSGGLSTGEVFFTSQALGFRHSHLDSGGYSFDQKHEEKDVEQAVDFLVKDEQGRVLRAFDPCISCATH